MKKMNEILEKWIPKEKKEKYSARHSEQPSASPAVEIEGINTSYGLSMAGKSVDNYFKILAVFHNEGKIISAKIRECHGKDAKLYITHVHALKSALANIGASSLSDTAKSLELAGKREDTTFIDANNDSFLKKLETLLDNIKHAISQNNAAKSSSPLSDILIEQTNEKLSSLKKSLCNMDTQTADKIINDLRDIPFDNNMQDAIEQIAQHVLLCDYDDAIDKINTLVEELVTD
jgi:HPt (histidine-containing phosphotransfer) domain-containing protein